MLFCGSSTLSLFDLNVTPEHIQVACKLRLSGEDFKTLPPRFDCKEVILFHSEPYLTLVISWGSAKAIIFWVRNRPKCWITSRMTNLLIDFFKHKHRKGNDCLSLKFFYTLTYPLIREKKIDVMYGRIWIHSLSLSGLPDSPQRYISTYSFSVQKFVFKHLKWWQYADNEHLSLLTTFI